MSRAGQQRALTALVREVARVGVRSLAHGDGDGGGARGDERRRATWATDVALQAVELLMGAARDQPTFDALHERLLCRLRLLPTQGNAWCFGRDGLQYLVLAAGWQSSVVLSSSRLGAAAVADCPPGGTPAGAAAADAGGAPTRPRPADRGAAALAGADPTDGGSAAADAGSPRAFVGNPRRPPPPASGAWPRRC